jgi:predicted negative regulator of RcsB-dependent stress response
MPKLIKKRLPKKTTDTETEVKEKLFSIKDTLKQKRDTALKFGAAVAIIIVAIVGLLVYYYSSQKKAKELESEAYNIYYSNSQAQAVNKDGQYKKALDIFKKAYDTKKSPASLFYIAACYYETGKYDDALKTLKDFVQRYSSDDKYAPLAYQKTAIIYIKKGDVNEAKKTLDALYNLKTDIYKDFALMEYGKLLEKEGKSDEAKKKYNELVTKFPNSPFKDEAKAKLDEKKAG